jgi:hypothetical protein
VVENSLHNWGGNNIFHSSGISWVCSTLVNEKQDFSVFCPYAAIQLLKKLLKRR